MSSAATSLDDRQDLRQRIRGILTLQKQQHLEGWSEMDSSGFEPASNLDLQAAVNDQLYSGTGLSDDFVQQRNHSGSLAESRDQADTACLFRFSFQIPLHLQAPQKGLNRLWKDYLPASSTTTMLSVTSD